MSVGDGDHFHCTWKILQKVLITITTILAQFYTNFKSLIQQHGNGLAGERCSSARIPEHQVLLIFMKAKRFTLKNNYI